MTQKTRVEQLKEEILEQQAKAMTMDDWYSIARLECELVAIQALPMHIMQSIQ